MQYNQVIKFTLHWFAYVSNCIHTQTHAIFLNVTKLLLLIVQNFKGFRIFTIGQLIWKVSPLFDAVLLYTFEWNWCNNMVNMVRKGVKTFWEGGNLRHALWLLTNIFITSVFEGANVVVQGYVAKWIKNFNIWFVQDSHIWMLNYRIE